MRFLCVPASAPDLLSPSRRRSKKRRQVLSIVLRGSVCSEAGQEAWTGSGNSVWSADPRLIDLSQTDQERARNIIRNPEVRDPFTALALLGMRGSCRLNGSSGRHRRREGRNPMPAKPILPNPTIRSVERC